MSLWTKYTFMFTEDTLPNSYEAIAYILLSKYWQPLTLTEHYTDLGNYCEIFFDLLKLYVTVAAPNSAYLNQAFF